MHRLITGICVLLLVSRCMTERMVEGDEGGMEGSGVGHRLRDRPGPGPEASEDAGGMGQGVPGTGQKSGEAPVYGLMKYFSYLTRSSNHNGQMLQAMKSIMAEVTETRIRVDQMNEKLDLILTRVTVITPQEQNKRAFSGFKIFN